MSLGVHELVYHDLRMQEEALEDQLESAGEEEPDEAPDEDEADDQDSAVNEQ